eukprot:PhF_6_TR4754/c0_g1_i1/m.6566
MDLVASLSEFDLTKPSRKVVKLASTGREVIVIHSGKQQFHAMDLRCYHVGYPLDNGDIEDFRGTGMLCIKCPYHNRYFEVCSGRLIDQVEEVDDKGVKETVVVRRGVYQRMHEVVVQGDSVWVRDSTTSTSDGTTTGPTRFASDRENDPQTLLKNAKEKEDIERGIIQNEPVVQLTK